MSSSSTTSAPISSSSLPQNLLDFLELVEARKMHVKSVLKQQVDAILEDFFCQLVTELRQMLKEASFECSPPPPSSAKSSSGEQLLHLSKVESVVCEPIIEMCLMEEGGQQQQQEQKKQTNPSTTQCDLKTTKNSPRSSKTAHKTSRKSEVMKDVKMETDSESDDQDEQMSHSSILSSSLKCTSNENFQQRLQTFQRAAASHLLHSHVFEVQQVSACNVPSELKIESPPPPLEPPALPPPSSVQLPSLTPSDNSSNLTPWICSTCDKKMKNERTLYMHQWRYHKEGEFRCTEASCNFIASYRIQLRTHQIRFHDLGKFSCPFPGCGRSFNRRNSLKRHERIHLRLKPYRCRLCDYASELRSSMIDHVRVTHFRLPRSRKEQLEMSIGDDRDPADYFEVIQEGLDLLEPVLEHVHSVLEAQQQQTAALIESGDQLNTATPAVISEDDDDEEEERKLPTNKST